MQGGSPENAVGDPRENGPSILGSSPQLDQIMLIMKLYP